MADIQKTAMLPKEPHQQNSRPCYKYLNYAPDTGHLEFTPMKYIRVNMHFMNSSDSLRNLSEKAGIAYAKQMLQATNHALNNNVKSLLPKGNDLDVLPTRYEYILTPRPNDPDDDGIYFHYDDECYYYVKKGKNRNIYEREAFKKYGVQKDTVLNIFFMPHHPDSVASETYTPTGTAVALGKFIKMSGSFDKKAKMNAWEMRGQYNHEVAHIFGLVHAWNSNDGCDDTPRHSMDIASNNLMDYNSSQTSFTPCQIGKIHFRMSMLNPASRKLLVPNWCELHEDRHIYIRDSIHWQSMKDLEGHLTIQSGGVLKISCRVSLPKNAKITVEPGGELTLDNCKLHNQQKFREL